MDRKVIYNGRVSKLNRPSGLRPSDYQKIFQKAWNEQAASIYPGLELPEIDFKISLKNSLLEVHRKNGEILFFIDPSTGQVSKAEDKELVAG